MSTSTAVSADLEFQLQTYIDAGYPRLAGLSREDFEELGHAVIGAAGPGASRRPTPQRSRCR